MSRERAREPWGTGVSPGRRPLISPAFLLLSLLLCSCASRSPAQRNYPDYSTAYLGPNGEIFYYTTRGGPKMRAEVPLLPTPQWSWWGDGVSGAVGMHAGYLPGYPASHGCIRLPHGAAEKFFQNAPGGTPVSIVH